MELHFGENIKRLRRERELTQEALATALGVTPQSVSKWECAYGYPDITQLPGIANFFGVTVDALLSNDADSREAEFARFREQLGTYAEGSEEKIAFIREYCRRYPDELAYAYYLSGVLRYHMEIEPADRPKYLPLLRETVEKLMEDPQYRNAALRDMICVCEEEDLDFWLELAPHSANFTRRSMLIFRYGGQDDGAAVIQHGLHAAENMAILLEQRMPDSCGAQKKAAYHRQILAVLESFGSEGKVPDGWLAFYAYKQLVLSACLFGQGDTAGGRTAFLSAMEKWHRYHSLSDEYLDMGGSLFGGVRVDKAFRFAVDPNGGRHKLYGTWGIGLYGRASEILALLTSPRWAWFNSVRGETWFTEAVSALAEIARTEKTEDEED